MSKDALASNDFKLVKLSAIEVKYNSRYAEEDLSDLMRSIKEQGLLEPVGVVRDGNKYRLAYGNRRYHACKRLGHKFIACMIQPYTEEKQEVIANATENFQRKQLSPYEKGSQINDLLTNCELTKKEVSVILGITLMQLNQFLEIYLDLPKKYRNDVVTIIGNPRDTKQKGLINSTIATKIIHASRRFNLTASQKDEMLALAKKGDLHAGNITKVSSILRRGDKFEDAMKNASGYEAVNLHFVISKRDKAVIDKSGLLKSAYVKKIIYGDMPPLRDKDYE